MIILKRKIILRPKQLLNVRWVKNLNFLPLNKSFFLFFFFKLIIGIHLLIFYWLSIKELFDYYSDKLEI